MRTKPQEVDEEETIYYSLGSIYSSSLQWRMIQLRKSQLTQ